MSKNTSRRVHVLSLVAASFFVAGVADAAPPTKEECVDAHGRAQDMREKSQLARARATFLVCANPACPSLVQADCAHYADELERLVPTVTFNARDGAGADLPNTQVFVDDTQVASRLDEGKAFDIEPGKHVVRFVHDGKEVPVKVVVSQGEKARPISAVFGDPKPATPAGGASTDGGKTEPKEPKEHRSALPLVVAGIGAAALGTGLALTFVGLGKVPDSCKVSSHECAAPPGSPVFDDAKNGVGLANIGLVTSIAGGAVMIGGLVWYFVQPTTKTTTVGRGVQWTPWASASSAGLGAHGTF
ncbi:hypothetical protein AKJ09_09173 [Labilithrix luteola]|uniref:PEGA domain-containing protein n=2 Tax=Labilithrix luteola TaxID=1391654 RepID=A0A0K1QAR1_9BACT|nr:hypothetical protein AKJ09_09173 [Labilithrix luteola]